MALPVRGPDEGYGFGGAGRIPLGIPPPTHGLERIARSVAGNKKARKPLLLVGFRASPVLDEPLIGGGGRN